MMSTQEPIRLAILDRDGIINDNRLHYYTYSREQWIWNEDVIEAMLILQQAGYQLAVFTNQGGVSKGLYSIEAVNLLHRQISLELEPLGIHIRDWLVCPHHPSLESCLCRKPQPLLLERLLHKYQANPHLAVLIGDSSHDKQAGDALGIQSFLVPANHSILPLCRQLATEVQEARP